MPTLSPSAKTVLALVVGVCLYSGSGIGISLAADCTTVSAASADETVAVDPLKKFAYVANPRNNTVSLYTIDPATGVRTHRQDLAAGPGHRAMAITQGAAVVRYTPNFAYVSKKTRTSLPRPQCAVASIGRS